MDGVTRIGVSLEPELLAEFDKIIAKKGYVSRSEAIRDLVRDSLAENEWKNEHEHMCGVITMIYDHDTIGLSEKITEIQHASSQNVFTTIHMHLDHDRCMEIVAVEGELAELKKINNDLGSLKGVLRCKLTMASKSNGHLHYIGVRND
ncbi:putative transcriptional regulators containing the CopG/Arc/MetJ DNA-binding domain and a metal-binding domain [Thermoplasmatales archaeon BRNA1]|nr:putative transcriptional regulators containing the CopG/Arc/MetJ DNA-binding domain and a metal-binding domain [Thermoplasmatales archaeon BRNA1]